MSLHPEGKSACATSALQDNVKLFRVVPKARLARVACNQALPQPGRQAGSDARSWENLAALCFSLPTPARYITPDPYPATKAASPRNVPKGSS